MPMKLCRAFLEYYDRSSEHQHFRIDEIFSNMAVVTRSVIYTVSTDFNESVIYVYSSNFIFKYIIKPSSP